MTLNFHTRIVYLLVVCGLLAVLALPVFGAIPAETLTADHYTGRHTLVEEHEPPLQIACTGGNAQGSCGGG